MMSVRVRNRKDEKGVSRRRHSPATARVSQHAPAPLVPPAPAARRVDDGVPVRRRMHGSPQDTATYHCHCGYVFEADVSTSVGCPHCGTGQAW
jgi:hypothetical protein